MDIEANPFSLNWIKRMLDLSLEFKESFSEPETPKNKSLS